MRARQGRQTLPIRVRVHLEPYLDEGVDALPIDPGAQFVGLGAVPLNDAPQPPG